MKYRWMLLLLALGVFTACSKKSEVMPPTGVAGLNNALTETEASTRQSDDILVRFYDVLQWYDGMYHRIIACHGEGGNCLIGAEVIADREIAFDEFQTAIGDYQLQRDFFNGDSWRELWPQLEGMDFLHLLQTEDVAIYEYPTNEDGQTIFACADPSLDPADVNSETAWLALTVEK